MHVFPSGKGRFMLKGFKDFLMRGNVIDLAVAVVVGAAFTAIVTAFTTNIIEPLINSIGGTDQAEGLGFTIQSGNPETFVDIGALITAIINFLIIAAIVYFVIVMPYEKLRSLAAKDGDDATALSESELLTEIRDILQGKDPVEEKAKVAAAKSEKDQAEIERRHGAGPQSSGPLSSGPLSGTGGAVGASAAGTQKLSAQPSRPIDGGGQFTPGPPSQSQPKELPPQGPQPGYQPPSGPPPGYDQGPPNQGPPPLRPNAPQYGPSDYGPQGPGYRPDPLTGPPPGYDPNSGPPPGYGPPPGRPADPDGGGRHSQ